MAAIDGLFEDLIKRGGSDLHLAVHQPPMARVRGELTPLRDGALTTKELEELLLELVTPAQRARLTSELEVDLSHGFKDIARFRATYYVKYAGLAAVFRLVPMRVPSLTELGCPDVIRRLVERRSGLLVVAGPSANGKTTTTAAMLDHVNKTRPCHIVTVEDPIEFVHEPQLAQVTQREVGSHTPTIAAGLRNAARENPDVVFVSKLGTADEIEVALQLANDGVLVVTNVTTSSAGAAIAHLVGMLDAREGAARAHAPALPVLADAFAGIVVQHLVRTADGKSRVAVHEIVTAAPNITALLREGRIDALTAAIELAEGQGAQSLDGLLEQLVSVGKISPEVALERAIDKEAFARVVARTRPDLVE